MKTEFVKINKQNNNEIIETVNRVLKNKGIVVLPTDTVYGLMTSVFNFDGQKQIYKLKNRSMKKPLILMSDNIKTLKRFVSFPKKTEKIVMNFWPGQLTLILPTTELGKLLTGGRDNLGVRIPNCKILLDIMAKYDIPLMTTSANISGKESAKNQETAVEYFNNKIDLIVDGGKCDYSFESTVIDMVKFPYVVIRKGCLDCKKLLEYI
ncbi:L-threonylcarbamoyladenylate synthase [Candidatus Ruminimicrobium bovinum]|uniref:L-threonylcarbamoyladenylate synthase n=1 Tax=Candidatus Ruminimicrobium bovinum TaxID=3242779 RepID=UPI0039B85268